MSGGPPVTSLTWGDESWRSFTFPDTRQNRWRCWIESADSSSWATFYDLELYVDDLDQYLSSSGGLLLQTEGSETLCGAHGAPRMPYARLEHLNELLGKIQRGEVRARPSLCGLVPQRRVLSGDIHLRMPCFGVKGLLATFLFGALVVVLLAVVVGVLTSWLYSIPVLPGGAVLVYLAYRRM
jgi:hypothetical protein